MPPNTTTKITAIGHTWARAAQRSFQGIGSLGWASSGLSRQTMAMTVMYPITARMPGSMAAANSLPMFCSVRMA